MRALWSTSLPNLRCHCFSCLATDDLMSETIAAAETGRARESPHQLASPEEVIEVPVGDVDHGQPLAGLLDHVAKFADLGLDVPRVGQDGVGLAGHESRAHGDQCLPSVPNPRRGVVKTCVRS